MRRKYLIAVLVLTVLAVPASPTHAAGVVSTCDEAHLLAALAGGGTVTFTCDGTIILTTEIVIAADTTIDATEQSVTISGNEAVRVFRVNPGVALKLRGLTVANGFTDTFESGGGVLNLGTLIVTNSTFSGNSAGGVLGGAAIYNYLGTVSVSDSIFSANSASIFGGGIANNNGAVTVTSSMFSDNDGGWNGGAIYNAGFPEVKQSAFFENGAGHVTDGRGIDNGGTLNVSKSTFLDNSALDGGGISNNSGIVSVSNSTFSGNTATYGGGLASDGGAATVNNSTFSSNTATYGGGLASDGGAATVNSSTFSGNSATAGGGVHNDWGVLTVTNSTFAGNNATSYGGGIYSNTYAEATVSNSTFANNSADAGGGVANPGHGPVALKNTIVANSPSGGNCAGTLIDGRGNLSFPDNTCPGINADPLLGPLQDNGGPTETMAPGPGSAAIDTGDDAICEAPPVNGLDQRGLLRPQGPHCDIGAVERLPFLPFQLWFALVYSQ